MAMMSKLAVALRSIFRRSRVERELDEELRFHLEMQTRENIRSGMSPQQASRRAALQLGGVEQTRERVREVRSGSLLLGWWQDFVYGLRMLRKQPLVTLIAGLTLAVGIGANSAFFSVVDGVLLSPLPYPEADRIVAVGNRWPGEDDDFTSLSLPEFLDLREHSDSFQSVAAYNVRSYNLSLGDAEAERVLGSMATPGIFGVLGTPATLGRTLEEGEEAPGADKVVVISHRLWTRIGADRSIIGRDLRLDGDQFQVVGVMPEGFHFPRQRTDLWLPHKIDSSRLPSRGSRNRRVVARLKPGLRLEQAQSEIDALAQSLSAEHPQHYGEGRGRGIALKPLLERTVGSVRQAMLVLLGAVGLLLLIACANVANLLLARGASRGPELAVRSAMGASRGRLVRQLLTESFLLSLFAGLAGLLLAWGGIEALRSLAGTGIPRIHEVDLDWRVLAFTLGASMATGLLAGIAPAWQGPRRSVHDTLKAEGRGQGGGAGLGLRRAIVVAEVALALVLLIGSGLLAQSFFKVLSVDAGLRTESIVTARINLSPSTYSSRHQAVDYFTRLAERIELDPRVREAGLINWLPFSGSNEDWTFGIEGYQPASAADEPGEQVRMADGAYFRVLGIPLLAGRVFDDSDRDGNPLTAVVSQSLARKYWGDESPVGRRIKIWGMNSGQPWTTVVGVVGDVRHRGLATEAPPILYFPYAQVKQLRANMAVVVHSALDPAQASDLIRREAQALDKNQPVYLVITMDEWVSRSLTQRRFNLYLLAAFSVMALLLALVGVSGVIAYFVSERTREIGIRMALGAQRRDILRMVLSQSARLTLQGAALGLAGAFALTRFMEGMLFQVSATEPIAYVGLTLLLVAISMLAAFVPARRAVRVSPLETFK